MDCVTYTCSTDSHHFKIIPDAIQDTHFPL